MTWITRCWKRKRSCIQPRKRKNIWIKKWSTRRKKQKFASQQFIIFRKEIIFFGTLTYWLIFHNFYYKLKLASIVAKFWFKHFVDLQFSTNDLRQTIRNSKEWPKEIRLAWWFPYSLQMISGGLWAFASGSRWLTLLNVNLHWLFTLLIAYDKNKFDYITILRLHSKS